MFTGKAELGQELQDRVSADRGRRARRALRRRLKVVTADTRPHRERRLHRPAAIRCRTAAPRSSTRRRRRANLLVAEAARRLRSAGRKSAHRQRRGDRRPTAGACATASSLPRTLLHVQAQPTSRLKDPATLQGDGPVRCRASISRPRSPAARPMFRIMRLPGMVHARVVRPPSYGAQLTDCDTARGRETARRRQGRARRQFPRRGRREGILGDQGDECARRPAAKWKESAEPARSRTTCSRC